MISEKNKLGVRGAMEESKMTQRKRNGEKRKGGFTLANWNGLSHLWCCLDKKYYDLPPTYHCILPKPSTYASTLIQSIITRASSKTTIDIAKQLPSYMRTRVPERESQCSLWTCWEFGVPPSSNDSKTKPLGREAVCSIGLMGRLDFWERGKWELFGQEREGRLDLLRPLDVPSSKDPSMCLIALKRDRKPFWGSRLFEESKRTFSS